MRKTAIATALFLMTFLPGGIYAQVSINNAGSTPDPSAVLDLSSDSRGLLVPRMSTTDRIGISNPAKGLIVLDTTSMAFYYYDGVEQWIRIATGSVKYDTASNLVVFDQNIIFSDSVEIYDDLKVPVNSLKIQGANNQPLWANITSLTGNLAAYHFDPDQMQQLFFAVQIPHRYKPGTSLYPHIHWIPETSGSGNVVWGIEYTWTNIGSVFGSTSSISGTGAVATGEQNKHKMTNLTSIDGTGKEESSMVICRMFRDAVNGSDTYPGNAILLEVDFHFRVNKLGEEFSAN